MKNYKLVKARAQAGLTQDEVSERVGINSSSYQRYEYGKNLPQLDIAIRLSNVLNVDVKELFEEFITKKEKMK